MGGLRQKQRFPLFGPRQPPITRLRRRSPPMIPLPILSHPRFPSLIGSSIHRSGKADRGNRVRVSKCEAVMNDLWGWTKSWSKSGKLGFPRDSIGDRFAICLKSIMLIVARSFVVQLDWRLRSDRAEMSSWLL
ncbi:hypothetical protein AKJ16_DCAP13257 [Drosera capensis]